MKKILALLSVLLCVPAFLNAGLISRTYTYTSGNTIDPNQNNTNENTLYTEINGNIEAANIKDGTITNADMADTQLVVTKFATSVQSTFTWVNTHGAYRRPVLQYISGTAVDVEANTGTSNETCIQFPDERRCVTENTSSTDKYRRLVITATATYNSGTEDSGGSDIGWPKTNTWGAVYAVKSVVNSSNFVLAITTNTPVQANYAALNTLFGTNGWEYLGMIRVGDNASATTVILNFVQIGNITNFRNQAGGNTAFNVRGIRFATTASAASLTYTYATGTGTTQLPTHCANHNHVYIEINGSTAYLKIQDAGGSYSYAGNTSGAGHVSVFNLWDDISGGIKTSDASANNLAMDIFLGGWVDGVLGVGYNPQL